MIYLLSLCRPFRLFSDSFFKKEYLSITLTTNCLNLNKEFIYE